MGSGDKKLIEAVLVTAAGTIITTGGLLLLWQTTNYVYDRMAQYFERRSPHNSLTKSYERLGRPLDTLPNLTPRERQVAAESVMVQDDDESAFGLIGGLEYAKQQLHQMITLPVTRPDLFSGSRLLSQPKGVLLYGPPGTGKTMLARAVAMESGSTFLSISDGRYSPWVTVVLWISLIDIRVSNLHDKWVGESEKIASAIFSLARKIAPCVVFFDEMDCLFGSRSNNGDTINRYQSSLMSVLMTEWDGIESDPNSGIVVLGATNRPEILDQAILRRLSRQLLIPLPDESSRKAILDIILRGEKLEDDVDTEALAKATPGYSGSDLSEMCKLAATNALSRSGRIGAAAPSDGSALTETVLSVADIREALRHVKPTGRAASDYATMSGYN